MSTITRTRPNHVGNWMEYYDGREAMQAAGAAALVDAASAEVHDGYPSPETAEEWVDAMMYYVATLGGGLAEWNAKPSGEAASCLARKVLVAAAYLCRATVTDRPPREYMPMYSVGAVHAHSLASLAYDSVNRGCVDWAAAEAELARVYNQYRNTQWAYDVQRLMQFAQPRR